MYRSELDIRHARERYADELVAARIRRLIRDAQAAQRPPARLDRAESLFVRVLDALRPRHIARA